MVKCRCCGSFSKSFRHAAATQHPNEICSCTANCNSFSKCMMIMMVYDWLTAADQENQKKQHGQLSNSIQIILEFLIIDHMIISTLRTVYWCLITKCELNTVWRPTTLQCNIPHHWVIHIILSQESTFCDVRTFELFSLSLSGPWCCQCQEENSGHNRSSCDCGGHDCRGEKHRLLTWRHTRLKRFKL